MLKKIGKPERDRRDKLRKSAPPLPKKPNNKAKDGKT